MIALDGIAYPTLPLADFRAQYGLPESFKVSYFEPKDYSGLGRIDGAGAALQDLRQAVLGRTPQGFTALVLLQHLPTLQQFFQDQLEAINPQIGLHQPEIEFAASGFGDALHAWVYALVAAGQQPHPPSFAQVYHDWVMASTRLAATRHPYQHGQQPWAVQIISNVYGRLGMLVHLDATQRYAVLDASLACPAEGFMLKLLNEVAAKMLSSKT
jgi:hypothetical protein